MNQQINLYQIEKKKPDNRVTFSQVSMGFLGYVAFLVLMALSSVYGCMVTKIEVSKLEKMQTQKQKILASMLDNVDKQKANEKVLVDLKEREAKNSIKKNLLNTLSLPDNKKVIKYSDYFEAVARRKIEDLWITKVLIKKEGSYLLIEGGCLRPSAIMQFITTLKMEPAFSGKIFQLFSVSFDEKANKTSFSLETGS